MMKRPEAHASGRLCYPPFAPLPPQNPPSYCHLVTTTIVRSHPPSRLVAPYLGHSTSVLAFRTDQTAGLTPDRPSAMVRWYRRNRPGVPTRSPDMARIWTKGALPAVFVR